MRIAVCFCGQVRTGVESSENIKRYLGEYLDICDFFIHTWDKNSTKNYNGSKVISKDEVVPLQRLEDYKKAYSPKRFLVENHYVETSKFPNEVNNIRIVPQLPAQWYSMMRSLQFKREYEIENNFEYDYVLKLRSDIIFPKLRNLSHEIKMIEYSGENTIYIENLFQNYSLDSLFVDDVYFLGKSKTMDVVGNYFYGLINAANENFKYGFPYNYGMIKHLSLNGITPSVTQLSEFDNERNYSYTIYRRECLEYSPNDEYEFCRMCDDFYFGVPPNKKLAGAFFIEEINNEYIKDENIFNIEGKVKWVDIDEIGGENLVKMFLPDFRSQKVKEDKLDNIIIDSIIQNKMRII